MHQCGKNKATWYWKHITSVLGDWKRSSCMRSVKLTAFHGHIFCDTTSGFASLGKYQEGNSTTYLFCVSCRWNEWVQMWVREGCAFVQKLHVTFYIFACLLNMCECVCFVGVCEFSESEKVCVIPSPDRLCCGPSSGCCQAVVVS